MTGVRAWLELPPDSGWGDTRIAASDLGRMDYHVEEQRMTGRVLLRLSGAKLDRAALWRYPGQS